MPSSDLWMETDIGFDEDITTPALVSDELQRELRTKLLWHFVPTYSTVDGTSYEQEFIRLGAAIYAAHWPEDTTYGIKPPCQRTCLSKRLVPPEEVDTTDWDLNAMPELYDGVDREKSIERNKLIRATLYSFYRNNNLKYQRMRAKYSDSEARQMWAALTKSIHAFLKKAITQASPYIKSYGLPPWLWKASLYGAVLLWAVHNLLPSHFHTEYRTWSRYRYLRRIRDDMVLKQIVWEYPERPDKDNNETVDLPAPWEPWRDTILF